MKFLVSLYIILMSVLQIEYHDFDLQKKAFEEVKKNINTAYFMKGASPCIKISNQVVPGSMTYFFDEFNNGSNTSKQRMAIIDSLKIVDEENYFEPYLDDQLSQISECDNPGGIAFFSQLTNDNKLFVELFKGEYDDKKYDKVALFNTSLVFLFTFNQEEEIEEFQTTTIQYN